MTDPPPLLIYQETCDHTLSNPRPGPRHALRADLYPRRPSELMTTTTPPDDGQRAPREFTQADGSTYTRVDPAAFPVFDDVDSRDIVDAGAPLTDDEVHAFATAPEGER